MKKLLLAGIIMLVPALLKAQTPRDSVDVGVKVTILQITSLAIVDVYDYDPNAAGNITPSLDDTVDYFDRYPGTYTVGSTQGTYAVSLETQVNGSGGKTWDLQTKGTGDFTSGTYTFALSNLEWALDRDPATQTFTPFSTTYTAVLTGQPVGRDTTYIDYRLTVPWTATPVSNYKTVTRYRLVTNP